MEIEDNKNLAAFTSWQVGGAAEKYVAPNSLEELKEAMIFARTNELPITLLGGGSNVLISDDGVAGLLIHTINLNKVEVLQDKDEVLIEAQAGAPKSEVLKLFLKYRLPPAVFLAGLPGDMGGGVVMNAGVGHKVAPREFCEIVKSFDVYTFNPDGDIEQRTFDSDTVHWSYRKSTNWQPGIITKVRVGWPNQPDDEVLKAVREGNKRRKTTQPLSQPSCGSVFKNPDNDHAGRLIEASGLKGMTVGGAQVSEKHANFIVNTGHATAKDIHEIIEKVQAKVSESQAIFLTNEVVYLGKW